jgi:glycosyltransferase involved in cell wall biosynthesis
MGAGSPHGSGSKGPRRLDGERVAFVLPSFSLSGAERQAFLLARHLKSEEGADVLLVSLGASGGIEKLALDFGLRCQSFTLHHRLRDRVAQAQDLLRFVRFLRRERVDVLLPYCMFQNVFCALTWRLAGVRACIWSQRDEGRERLERWVERTAVNLVSCFVSNSQHAAAFLIDTLGRPREMVHVIPNGIEIPEARQSPQVWRERIGLAPTAFVACMAATLHYYKDHPTLIDAWRIVVDRLSADGRDAHLVLAGQHGPRHPELVRQVAALGLEKHVHFVGEVEDIGGLFRSVDLCVFSSYSEGVPNAVLEAMGCGLPVVGTDYAGIREAVGPSGFDRLAPPRDPEQLAVRILDVTQDPERARAAGLVGRQRVLTHFGLTRMCDRSVRLIMSQMAGYAVSEEQPSLN